MAGIEYLESLEGGIDLENLGLPISNSENKQLEAQVQQKEKQITLLQRKAGEHKDRIQAITEHLKNVRQELQQTQELYGARKRDRDSEGHLRQIAEREEGRLKEEINRMELEREDMKDKMNIYENTIFRSKEKIEEIKGQMNWGQQALEAWLEESARHDDDAITLAKYARADESKIKEVTLKLEHLMESETKQKRALNNETNETLTAQISLDKTAEAFRTAHRERQDVIRQWEHTIDQMRKRDQDMNNCANELAELKSDIETKEDNIREKQEFFDDERQNNAEKEKKVDIAERVSAKKRLDYQDSETARVQFKDELETLKHSVDRTAADLDNARTKSTHLSREVKDKRKKLETLQKQREMMQQELKKSTQKTLSAEERAQNMDQILANEESRVAAMEKELTILREKQFKHAQEVFELKQKDTIMQAETQGSRAALRNLGSKQLKLDEEALKQQEILYTQDFQLQQLQHKLNRMDGERTDDEKNALSARIKELEGHWGSQQGEEHLLTNQLKRLQDDLRRVNRHLEKGQAEMAILAEKIDEINLHIDNTQRELKKVVTAKQSKMVDENIIKLEVKRLRDILYSHSDEVQSLEKRQLQLSTAMSERSREIVVHKDMLRVQMKACESERQTLSFELHERISRIDKLRKRYEILATSIAPPEGEEEQSQAYYVIKAAQEREELQRSGDELDAKIRKAEKEIRALENTLQLMNSKNESFRKSLNKVDKSSEELAQLDMLEGQYRAALDKHKHKRRNTRQVDDDLQAMNKTLSTLVSDEDTLNAELSSKQAQLASLNKDLEDLKAKRDRVSKQTSKLSREIRSKQKVSGHDSSDVEHDIELRESRDFGGTVISQMGGLASREPELLSAMQLLFSQAGLPPPPSPMGSRAGSLPSSARSSTSQLSIGSARSFGSRLSTAPSTPLQPKAIDIGGLTLTGSAASTLRAGMSPRSSSGSVSSRNGPPQSRQSSRQSSKASSRLSSRASSRTSSAGRSKKSEVDFTIGPP